MKRQTTLSIGSLLSIVIFALSGSTSAQNGGSSSANNPFAPNPKTQIAQRPESNGVPRVILETANSGPNEPSLISVADSTLYSKRPASAKIESLSTGRYSIGTNDILEINLSGQKGRQYRVSIDGTIEMPLAGGTVFVAGKTTSEVEAAIKGKTAMYSNSALSVVVIDRSSHNIEVTGAVGSPGIVHLQRDAVPLYVICATVLPDAGAKFVKLTRFESGVASEMKLELLKQPDFLIQPNDRVEFIGDITAKVIGYYYIAGRASTAGKQDLTEGLKLTNVIDLASLEKGSAKRVRLRSRTAEGTLKDTDIEIKTLRNGKTADVVISQGSIVEFLD